jgi:hypothetical protein
VTAAGNVDSRQVVAAPGALSQSIVETLEARNLPVSLLPAELYVDAFSTQRTTAHRLRHLAELPSTPELLVLLEATPRFDSQLNGRYRWVVDITLSVAPAQDLDRAQVERFDVPVFLGFHHQRESEALAAAAPVVQRHLGRLLDGYLGGL